MEEGTEIKISKMEVVTLYAPVKLTIYFRFRDDVRLISFWDVISLGKKTTNNNLVDIDAEPVKPTASSPAIIMYTSGSTGNPKVLVRVIPDTDMAGYPAAGYPANNFAGYRIFRLAGYRISG